MELTSQEASLAKDVNPPTSSMRVHTFVMVPKEAWEPLQLLINERMALSSKDLSLFELFRPMPEIFLTDVNNDEYQNKPNRDVGDVAVVVVDGIIHDTKRSMWISKNWGCDLPSRCELIHPGSEPSFDVEFPEAPAQFITSAISEVESSYKRLGCEKGELGFIHIVSNSIPTTFLECMSDLLNTKIDFLAIDSVLLKNNQDNFYDVVTRGQVSDWGVSIRKKPFTLENYSLSSIFIKILLLALIIYLLYSYTFGV